MLDCLSFRINTPTPHTFLSMYKQALALQPRTCALASYLVVSARGVLKPECRSPAAAPLGFAQPPLPHLQASGVPHVAGLRPTVPVVVLSCPNLQLPTVRLLPPAGRVHPTFLCHPPPPPPSTALQELAMLEYDLLRFSPSHVASAATLLAQLYLSDTQSVRQVAGGWLGVRDAGNAAQPPLPCGGPALWKLPLLKL